MLTRLRIADLAHRHLTELNSGSQPYLWTSTSQFRKQLKPIVSAGGASILDGKT